MAKRESFLNNEGLTLEFTQDSDFKFLLFKIKHLLGVDFSEYRYLCLKRRIDSRLRMNNLENYRQYAHFLEHNKLELDQLLKLLTIHLTEFFRDKSAWDVIKKKIIPHILQQKSDQKDKAINVWSAGSSSGEEAYTLAILFDIVLGQQIENFSLKIYGTDIDKNSLKLAKEGCYSEKKIQYIPKSILKKYFSFDGRVYQVNLNIRQLTSFQYDDLIASEFKKSMDLIVCRNVLIYFNHQLQIKILEKFNKLLNPNAFLMLGKTESIPYQSQPNLRIFNAKERIYCNVIS